MNTTSFRVRVMKFAHHIYETTNCTWSAAVIKAWTLYRLAKGMRKGVVKFFYEKVDGSARVAYGTLCDLPAGITSLASIRYKDEEKLLSEASNADETYVRKVLPEKMKYNLAYTRDFGFFSDMKLMIQTVFEVAGS